MTTEHTRQHYNLTLAMTARRRRRFQAERIGSEIDSGGVPVAARSYAC